MRIGRLAAVLTVPGLIATGCEPSADAPRPEYRSAAGVAYGSLPDTGPVARAESALARHPHNVDTIVRLGIALSGARRFREAIAIFTRGLEMEPRNALLYRWRGHRYLSVREYDSAKADLMRGAEIDSTIYGIWYHLGVVRYVTGDFAGAAEAFAKALPRAPEPGELAGSVDWLWMSLTRAGSIAEAQAHLARSPDSIAIENAYTQRIRLYRGKITPEQFWRPADTNDVQVATMSYGLGNWFLVAGDTARAKVQFERSVQSGGWPAFGFMASEAELQRLSDR